VSNGNVFAPILLSTLLSVLIVVVLARYSDLLRQPERFAVADVNALMEQIPVGATEEEMRKVLSDFDSRVARVSKAGIRVFDAQALLSRAGVPAIPANDRLLGEVAAAVAARREQRRETPEREQPGREPDVNDVPTSILSPEYLQDLPR
jgi:hypothetical protein